MSDTNLVYLMNKDSCTVCIDADDASLQFGEFQISPKLKCFSWDQPAQMWVFSYSYYRHI